MKHYEHPAAETFELTAILHALSDPYRLWIVQTLAQTQPLACTPLQGGRPKSSVSHHFSVLRRAGLVWTEVVGTTHMNSLRTEELEHLFPGLLAAVLRAAERAQ
ncbi:ArsR/SmtB family transcription factor [Acetobacter orientalis]|uniref:ArsR/SmtB family transcription factor n=1 Tax=Acetobacter orientalis TaxID=146474 RepID=UPI00264B0855|nr:ArsR family transcriptional regulator [Acetobacter sp.]